MFATHSLPLSPTSTVTTVDAVLMSVAPQPISLGNAMLLNHPSLWEAWVVRMAARMREVTESLS